MDSLNNKYEKFLPLINKIVEGKCVVLVGAGVSSKSGIVNSSQLVERLCENYQKKSNTTLEKKCNELTLDEIASYFKKYFKDHVAEEQIKDIIEESQKNAKTVNNLYNLFSSWPQSCLYVTTNYDTLLETTFRETIGQSFVHVIYNDEHIKDFDEGKVNIIKLHGSVEEYTSILTSKMSMEKIKDSKMFKHIQTALNYKDMLIIGQSSSDPDILYSIDGSNEGGSLKIYAIAGDDTTLTRFQSMNCIAIKEDLKTALEELTVLIDRKRTPDTERITTYKLEQEKIERGKRIDHNPFKFWTTDGLNNDDFKELLDVFVEPNYAGFSKIYNTDKHIIVQGARGTGKTVLLRSLSLEYIKNFTSSRFFGFWIPMTTQFMGPIIRPKDIGDTEWYNYFASYMSTFIVEKSLESSSYLDKINSLQFNNSAVKKYIDKVKSDFGINNVEIENLRELYDQISKYREEKYYVYDNKEKYLSTTYYRRYFQNVLPILDPKFDKKYVFVVLDDAHFLSDEQKRVIVTFLANRTFPVSFKIGTAHNFGVFKDYFGSTIQDSKDYETVYLDRISGEAGIKQYFEFLRKLTNLRLEKSNQKIQVSELLPSFRNPPSLGVHYAGFNDYATLSSQITRDYITLLKDTIYYGYPDINSKFVELKPISPQTQDVLINIKSAIKLSDIDNAELESPKLHILVNALGGLFRTIYSKSLESGTGEIRTTTGIEIVDFNNLTEKSKTVIQKGIELQVFQIPMTNRLRDPSGIPYKGLKFHRLICPYFKLKLGYRYPKALRAEEINRLLESGEIYINKYS